MKILYRQHKRSDAPLAPSTAFDHFGIEKCYLKHILSERDDAGIMKKQHSHTGFELHLLECGTQVYDTEDGRFEVRAGTFLLIPPNQKHSIAQTEHPVCKYGLTFEWNSHNASLKNLPQSCVCETIPPQVLENLGFILVESKLSVGSSKLLIGNRVLESLFLLLRAVGAVEPKEQEVPSGEDERVEMAKQYIRDNLHTQLQVSDVASYCYVSTKQLTRLFYKVEGIAPSVYLKQEKVRYIESLLSDTTLSIKEISEGTGFQNEYYFNTFFKKYYGMPPGQYRKMF